MITRKATMALETFSVGEFARYPEVAEWDGKNHDEIAEWLNRLDHQTSPDRGWRVTAVTDKAVTFFKPTETNDRMWPSDREVVVRRGQWICAVDSASAGSNLRIVAALDPAGKWKTTDPHGRPDKIADLMARPNG